MRTCFQTVLGVSQRATTVLLNGFSPSVAFQEEAEESGSPSAVLSSPLSILKAATLKAVGDGSPQEV